MDVTVLIMNANLFKMLNLKLFVTVTIISLRLSIMFIFLLFLAAYICTPQYRIVGLNNEFDVDIDSVISCNNTLACYDIVCQTVKTHSFTAVIPIFGGSSWDNLPLRANMMAFDIDENFVIINDSTIACNTFLKCVNVITTSRTMWHVLAVHCY